MRNINGTLIASYYAWKRELWCIAHEILPDEDNSFVELEHIVFFRKSCLAECNLVIDGALSSCTLS